MKQSASNAKSEAIMTSAELKLHKDQLYCSIHLFAKINKGSVPSCHSDNTTTPTTMKAGMMGMTTAKGDGEPPPF